MPPSGQVSKSVSVRLSSRYSLVDSLQEITLLTALNSAIDQLSECFDDCNRRAEPGSPFSQQVAAYEKTYSAGRRP